MTAGPSDAAVHVKLADRYNAVAATISQGDLFRVEAAAVGPVVLLVLFWRHRFGNVLACLVAAAYEPFLFTDRVVTAQAQSVAVAAVTALLPPPGRGVW